MTGIYGKNKQGIDLRIKVSVVYRLNNLYSSTDKVVKDQRAKSIFINNKKSWFFSYNFEDILVYQNNKKNIMSLKSKNIYNVGLVEFYTNNNYIHLIANNMLLINIANLYTFIDSSIISKLNAFSKLVYITTVSCLLQNLRIIYYTNVYNNKIYSCSNIFKGSQWVEREIQELNSVIFYGLTDTRRLLTDYTVKDVNNLAVLEEGVAGVYTSYNHITQELY